MKTTLGSLALLMAMAISSSSATRYAQFCDDSNCSTNCGQSVSVENPGCLNESGRNSVKFHGGGTVEPVDLVSSPAAGCNCQNYCYEEIVIPDQVVDECVPLTGPTALSYRFVGDQSCDQNNC